MTTIESKKVLVPAPAEKVFSFLQNTDNLLQLLPQDKITEWKSTGTECSFKIQGAYTIGLKLKSSTVHSSVVYESSVSSPFPFTLEAILADKSGATEAWQVCNAEINPFLQMLVKGPLKNLFDYMADQLVVAVK